MADGVQIQLERMVPELVEYATVGVFSVDEVKRIVKRRRDFEYLVALKSPQLKNFLEYVQFEISLDSLHRHRRAKQELTSTSKDFVGFARVRKIYRRALRVFPQDRSLWYQFVDFCLRTGSYSGAVNAIVEALGRHPTDTALWLLASDRELKMGHLQSARTLLLRGLRATRYQDIAMWKFYMKFECEVTLRLVSAKLTAAENASAPRSEVFVDLQAPLVVASHVLERVPTLGTEKSIVGDDDSIASKAATLKTDLVDVQKFLCYCIHISNSLMLSSHSDHLIGVDKLTEMCLKKMSKDYEHQPLFAAYGWKLKALKLKDSSQADRNDFLPAIIREANAAGRGGDNREEENQNREVTARLLALFTMLYVAADDRWESLNEGYREIMPCNEGDSEKATRKRASSNRHNAEENRVNDEFDISDFLEIDANPKEVHVESEVDGQTEPHNGQTQPPATFTPMADDELSFWTSQCNGDGANCEEAQIGENFRRLGHISGSRLADSEGTFLDTCFLRFPKSLGDSTNSKDEVPDLRLQLLVAERDHFWSVVCTEETLEHLLKNFLQNKVLVKRHSAAVPLAIMAAERLAISLYENGPALTRVRSVIRKYLQKAVQKWIPHDKSSRLLYWKMKSEPLAESDVWSIVDFVEDCERFFSGSAGFEVSGGKQLSALEGAELVKLVCRQLTADQTRPPKKRKARKDSQEVISVWKRLVSVLLSAMELQPFTTEAGGTNSLVGLLKLLEVMRGREGDDTSIAVDEDILDWVLASSFCLGAGVWQRFSARAGFLEVFLREALEQLTAIQDGFRRECNKGDTENCILPCFNAPLLDIGQKTVLRAVFFVEKLEQLVKDHEQRHFQRSSFAVGLTSKAPLSVPEKEKDAQYWRVALQPRPLEAMEDAGVPLMCQKVAFKVRKDFLDKQLRTIKEAIIALDLNIPSLGSRIMSSLPPGGPVRSLLHVSVKSIECA